MHKEHPTKDGEEVSSTFGMKVYHFILWVIFVDESDDFVSRLRKTALGILLIAAGAPVVSAAWLFYAAFVKNDEIELGVTLSAFLMIFGFVPVCVLPYIVTRNSKDRQVTTRMIDGIIFILLLMMFINTIAWPSFGNRAIFIGLALFSIVAQAGYAPFHCALAALLYTLDAFNTAFRRDGATYFLVPDYHYGPAGEEFIMILSGGFCASLVIIGVHFQSLQQKAYVAEAQSTAELSHKVVDLLRKYNTEAVRALLDSAAGADPALVESLSAMNRNLEQYKPYLPNFLFNESEDEVGSGDDDEDESRSCVTEDLGSPKNQLSHSGTSVSSFGGNNSGGSVRQSGSGHKFQLRSAFANAEAAFEGKICSAIVECPKMERSEVILMSTFLDAIHFAAKETRASIHNMVGDWVSVTWNGTSRTVQPELKAVRFALLVGKVQKNPAAAVFTGQGRFYSLTSRLQQHANLMNAEWFGAQRAVLQLARRHNARLVCDQTFHAVEQFVEGYLVDRIRFEPDAVDSAVSELDEVNGSRPASNSKQLSVDTTAMSMREVFEVTQLFQHKEEEWMYQLEEQSNRAKWTDRLSAATRELLQGKDCASRAENSSAVELSRASCGSSLIVRIEDALRAKGHLV